MLLSQNGKLITLNLSALGPLIYFKIRRQKTVPSLKELKAFLMPVDP